MSVYRDIPADRQPVLVRGVRTPFVHSGGIYRDLRYHELAAVPLAAVLADTGVSPGDVELVTMGNVAQDVETTNLARESMLTAGYPATTPGYTISMAGISPNVGVANLCDMIALGRLHIGVAAGCDSFSDLPVRLSRGVRQRGVRLALAKSTRERLRILSELRPRDLRLDVPSGRDLTTGQTMGEATEVMVQRFGVTRAEADAFAVRSHLLAAQAWDEGQYGPDVVPVHSGTEPISRDNTIRRETSIEALSRLKPSFDPQRGIITPGNASGINDGATAMLLMSAGEAARREIRPLAYLRDYQLAGVNDLATEMLLGPAMSIPPLLQRNRLQMQDIDVFELHEAFAAQILANQRALGSREFAREKLGMSRIPGAIPLEKLNRWGGSLALGNPFAATGGRILNTAARRLQAEDGRFAVVSTCAGGGLGAALLLERAGD